MESVAMIVLKYNYNRITLLIRTFCHPLVLPLASPKALENTLQSETSRLSNGATGSR